MELLKCTVVSIINPAEYLLLSQDEKHILEIKNFEKLLSKEMRCHKYMSYETRDFMTHKVHANILLFY